jgi:putative CocE/NonD family hydrolase
MVQMRDGVRLSTDLYLPEGTRDRLPVILIRTPYDKRAFRKREVDYSAYVFATQGYAVVAQDIRGRFASEGEFVFMGGDARDAYDTTEWISKQIWSNGKVGTYGCSYLGEVQYQQATLRNPHLVAMVPQAAGAVSRYRDGALVTGGALELASVTGWLRTHGSKLHYLPPRETSVAERAETDQYYGPEPVLPEIDYSRIWSSLPIIDMLRTAGGPPTDYEVLVRALPPPTDLEGQVMTETTNPWWKQTGYIASQQVFDVPALHINAWYDWGVAETLKMFNLMRVNAESAHARDNQFAIISPTTHCDSEEATQNTVVGERPVGDARLDYFNVYLRWFDHWLKGADNGVTGMPKLQIYVMGRNRWRSENEWPLARTVFTKYYLHGAGKANSRFGDGSLTPIAPQDEDSDQYTYDPRTPVPTVGGTRRPTSWYLNEGSFDQSEVEMRNDVLVYTSPVLQEGLEVTGPVKALLYVSSSAKDTDFTVTLVDVYPDGTPFNVQNGILRARYRLGFDKKVWLKPNEVYPVPIDLQATSNFFAPGHRIRVEVSSSSFPRFDRNLNTGGSNYDETAWLVAKNAIHHSAPYPSYILLPVIPDGATQR